VTWQTDRTESETAADQRLQKISGKQAAFGGSFFFEETKRISRDLKLSPIQIGDKTNPCQISNFTQNMPIHHPDCNGEFSNVF